jgi:hypothetical protein
MELATFRSRAIRAFGSCLLNRRPTRLRARAAVATSHSGGGRQACPAGKFMAGCQGNPSHEPTPSGLSPGTSQYDLSSRCSEIKMQSLWGAEFPVKTGRTGNRNQGLPVRSQVDDGLSPFSGGNLDPTNAVERTSLLVCFLDDGFKTSNAAIAKLDYHRSSRFGAVDEIR